VSADEYDFFFLRVADEYDCRCTPLHPGTPKDNRMKCPTRLLLLHLPAGRASGRACLDLGLGVANTIEWP